MKITAGTLYWLTRLDGIQTVCTIILAFSVAAALFSLIARIMLVTEGETDEDVSYRTAKKINNMSFLFIGLSLLAGTFVPTSKEMAMMYVVPHIAESQVIKQDMPEIYDMGVKALKDWLKTKQGEEK